MQLRFLKMITPLRSSITSLTQPKNDVAFTYRGENIRMISARLAEPYEREEYEEQL